MANQTAGGTTASDGNGKKVLSMAMQAIMVA
jgi:hypothetical protein